MLNAAYNAVRVEHGAGWRSSMEETRLQRITVVECGVEVIRTCLVRGEEICPHRYGWRRFVWLEGYYSGLNESLAKWVKEIRTRQLH